MFSKEFRIRFIPHWYESGLLEWTRFVGNFLMKSFAYRKCWFINFGMFCRNPALFRYFRVPALSLWCPVNKRPVSMSVQHPLQATLVITGYSLHSCLLITLPFPLKMWSDFVIMLLRTQHLQWNPFQFISANRLKSKQLPLPFSTSVLKTGESLDEEIHLPTLYRHAPVLCSGRSTGSTQTMGLNFWWAQLRIL